MKTYGELAIIVERLKDRKSYDFNNPRHGQLRAVSSRTIGYFC